jgi:hypothetical protein
MLSSTSFPTPQMDAYKGLSAWLLPARRERLETANKRPYPALDA